MTESTAKEQKGFLRYFIISMIFVLLSLVTVRQVKMSLGDKIKELDDQLIAAHEVIDEAKELSLALSSLRLGERGYLLTGEELYLGLTQENSQTFKTTLAGLLDQVGPTSPGGLLLLALETNFEHLMNEAVEPLLALRPPIGEPIEIEDQARFSTLMDTSGSIAMDLSHRIETFIAIVESDFLQIRGQLQRLLAIDRRTTIIGPVVIIVITLLSGIFATIRLDRYKTQQQRDQGELRIARDRLAMVITSSSIGTWEWGILHDVTTINDRFASLIGYERSELEPFSFKHFQRYVHPDDFIRVQAKINELFANTLEFYSCDIRMRHKDGHWVWVLDQGQMIKRDDAGNPLLMIGTHTDISDRITAAEELKKREEESRKLLETMNQGFLYGKIIVDDDGAAIDFTVLRVNKGFTAQIGLSEAQLVGRRYTDLVTADDYKMWIQHNGEVALTGNSATFEAYGAVSRHLFRVSSYCPLTGHFAMILDDITQERELERRLAEEKNLFEITLFNIADGVITTDEHGLVQFLNASAEELTGWQSTEARGQKIEEVFRIFDGPDGARSPSPFVRVAATHGPITADEGTILISRDGVQRYIGGKATPIIGSDSALLGIVIIVRDITEERKRQQEILSLSYIDPLTTLNNRRFYDQHRVELDSGEHFPLSLILADVNGLKLTNDAFGHEAGDELLQIVGATLLKACPPEAILTRIGGDEFVILQSHTDTAAAKRIIETAIQKFSQQRVRGIPVSVSFGHAVKNDVETPFETIFKRAEDAMYQNKLAINLRYKKAVITTVLNRLFENYPALQVHSEQVGFYSSQFARVLGFPQDEIAQMRLAGLHHDIGRISIAQRLLKKKEEELTKSELIELRRHAEIGYNILSSVPDYAFIAQAVLHHHERWDGRGYPQGLQGAAIPRSAQVLGIANFFVDVLETAGQTEESACRALRDSELRLFDPALVRRFIDEVVLPHGTKSNS